MFDERYVTRLDIHDEHDQPLLSNVSYEVPSQRSRSDGFLLIIKGSDMAECPAGTTVVAIACNRNGDRLRYRGIIGVASSRQWNIYLQELVQTDEDRRSFCKVEVDCTVQITAFTREDILTTLSPPALFTLKDISAGGMFIKHALTSKVIFEEQDLLVAVFDVMGSRLENTVSVLRKQYGAEEKLLGYGCRFIGMSTRKEELLARFVYQCQLARNSR